MGRKLLAGVLGGIAFFAWSGLAHMVLPLGETGVKQLPDEQPVVAALQSGIPARGLYMFPGTGLPADATRAQKQAAMEKNFQKIAAGPSGLLLYHPARPVSFRKMLMIEGATNVVQLLLLVFLLGQTSLASFGARWGFVTVAGILAAISTNVSYWNWYGFPTNYTLAYTFTIAMGFVVAGLVAAAIVKPGAAIPATRAASA